MAGAGYKLFQTGDVLTASQVNTYLNEQTVMVFASSAARTSALSSVLAEGMVSYLQDTNAVEVYDGSNWVSIGSSGDITGITTGATSGLTGGVTSGTADLKLNTTAKGGLLVGTGSGTVTELAVGTNNHILTADSSTASGLKWAAAASSGALTIISPTSIANSGGTASASGGQVTFSGVNSVSLNGVFSSTYDNYLIWIEANAASGNRTGRMRLRASGTDNTTSNYRSGYIYSGYSGTAVNSDNRNNVDYWVSYYLIGTESGSAAINIASPNLTKFTRFSAPWGINDANATFSGTFAATTSFDGITFYPEATDTFTGKIRVYGYSNS